MVRLKGLSRSLRTGGLKVKIDVDHFVDPLRPDVDEAQPGNRLVGARWLIGNRFDLVLVDGSIADAETVAARLVAAVGPQPIPGGTLRLSAVAGVTALLPDVDTGEALRRGDLALRSARTAGSGAVHRYDDALRIEQDRRDALRTDLDGALTRGELREVLTDAWACRAPRRLVKEHLDG